MCLKSLRRISMFYFVKTVVFIDNRRPEEKTK